MFDMLSIFYATQIFVVDLSFFTALEAHPIRSVAVLEIILVRRMENVSSAPKLP